MAMRMRGQFWFVLMVGVFAGGLIAVLTVAAVRKPATNSPTSTGETRVSLSDNFGRTVERGWGEAPVGGPYVMTADPADYSVADGKGRVRLIQPGSARTITLGSKPRDVEVAVSVTVPKLPRTGSGVYVAINARSDGEFFYRAAVRFAPDHKAYLSISRFYGGPEKRTDLLPDMVVGTGLNPGDQLRFAFQVAGVAPVQLSAALRTAKAPDDVWQATTEDADASRIVTGGRVALWFYPAKGAAGTRLTLDDLTVTHLADQTGARGGLSGVEPRSSASRSGSISVLPDGEIHAPGIGASDVGTTDFQVPTRAVFVATDASDAGTGSVDAPYASVQQAVDQARDGATVVLRGGTYHERVVLPEDRRITLQSYPREAVWLDGSVSVKNWIRDGEVWVSADWTARFDSSPSYTRGAPDDPDPGWTFLDPARPMATHPDQVWVDDRAQEQVGRRDDVGPGKFFVDEVRQELVLGSDPDGRRVRASALDKALTVLGAGDVVRGIGIRRYATSVWQFGTVTVNAPQVEVRDVVLSENATTGLSVQAKNVRLRDVTASRNGMLGVHAHRAHGLQVRGLLATSNNVEGFNRAPVAGGAKLTSTRGASVRHSAFGLNAGHGLWFDINTYATTVVGSRFQRNAGAGFLLEISGQSTVVDNLITDNGSVGLWVIDSNQVEIANNTLARNADRNLSIVTDRRWQIGQKNTTRHPDFVNGKKLAWISHEVSVYNNVLVDGGGNCVVCVGAANVGLTAAELETRIDHNYYQRSGPGRPRIFSIWPSGKARPLRFEGLAAHQLATGQDRDSALGTPGMVQVGRNGQLSEMPDSVLGVVPTELSATAARAAGDGRRSPRLGAALPIG